jgi:hypothetical protein
MKFEIKKSKDLIIKKYVFNLPPFMITNTSKRKMIKFEIAFFMCMFKYLNNFKTISRLLKKIAFPLLKYPYNVKSHCPIYD